jgi:bacterioferritin-associated ferredoxin
MGRKEPRFDIEEKIAREMLRLMPNGPKAFTWFFKKVEHFNYREPVTFIAEARAKLEASALIRTEVSPKTARRLQRLMAKLPVKEQMGKCFDEAAKFLKKEAANDPRYSLLNS